MRRQCRKLLISVEIIINRRFTLYVPRTVFMSAIYTTRVIVQTDVKQKQ